MTRKTLLRAGAGLSVLALATAPALARPAKKHAAVKHASSHGDEVSALRAQVEALTARLDAQEANQQATQQALHDAQEAATAAATQAQAAQTQAAAAASAVPDQVKVALDKEPRMKPQWFDNTTISGRMYFNFSNINQKQNGDHLAGEPNGHNNGTGFNIKRMYLGIDHNFSSVFSANLTMDVANVIGRTSNGDFNGLASVGDAQLVGRGFYIKKAYLQAKINPALIIRAGSADMPWIPYVEGIYGYRHIENTLIDHAGFGTSADWGVHVLGDVAGGIVSYQLSMVNGAGYRNVKVSKSVDFEGRVSAAYKGFVAAVGGYTGKLGNDVQRGVGAPPVTHHTATRLDALVGYKDKRFTVGGEYFYASNWSNNGLTPVTSPGHTKSDGYSAFASFNFNPKWSVFGRYDRVRPDFKLVNISSSNVERKTRNTYYNVGVQWEPVKIVDLALVYKHERTTDGLFADTNGTIGGTTFGNGSYNEIGVFGQLKF